MDIFQDGRAIAPFEINERDGDGHHRGMLPNLPEYTGVAKALIQNAEQYVAAWEAVAKALTPPPEAFAFDRISQLPDPNRGGVLPWPGIPPESLRKVAGENVGPKVVIQSRVMDITRYSQPSTHPWRPGWRIELRNGNEHPSEVERREMRAAERFLINCNSETSYSDPITRDASGHSSFSQFLRKMVRDTMRYDGIAIWTRKDDAGRVTSFTNLPASSIRMCTRQGYRGNPAHYAVMVDEANNILDQFTRDELVWYIRNPRSDIGINGYGYSELEMAIEIIIGLQNAINLNVSTFDKNGIPNGILKLMGDGWSDKPMDALARMWLNMKRGISKYWALPAIAVPKDGDVEILNLNDLKDTDVRYKDHMNMMIGFYCAITGFPIRRLGYHASGKNKDAEPNNEGSIADVGDDDPGLGPLLTDLEEVINPYLLWTRWPHLVMRFNAKSPKEDARQYEARANSLTWGEHRAENDAPPLTDVVSEEYRELAELMEMSPKDSNLAAIFQTVATTWIQAKYPPPAKDGEGGGAGKTPATPGSRTGESKDPAKSEAHGKVSGVRRDSRVEKKK